MKYKERLNDKHNAQESHKMEVKQKGKNRNPVILFWFLGIFIAFFLISSVFDTRAKQQEQELQAIVDQIMIDIENEDFAAAYVRANFLYWDDSLSSDGVEKWDATREEIINQIEKAEKKATGTTTNSTEEDGGFWDWFD